MGLNFMAQKNVKSRKDVCAIGSVRAVLLMVVAYIFLQLLCYLSIYS